MPQAACVLPQGTVCGATLGCADGGARQGGSWALAALITTKTFTKVAFMVRTVAGEEYLAILLLLIIALLFGVLTLFFGRFFRMRRPYREKLMPYESGNEPTAAPRTRFSIKFYYVAILFVIIDVEAIFLYTWAVEFVRLGSLGLVEMLTFMTLLILAYAYAWKKGAFEWVK